MAAIMQRNQSPVMVSRSLQRAARDRRSGAMTAAAPGTLSAGAEIFRRIERRPRQPRWPIALMICVAVVAVAGGVIAYQAVLWSSHPPVVHTIVPGD